MNMQYAIRDIKPKRSFKYQGVKVWNSIPVSFQTITFTGLKKITSKCQSTNTYSPTNIDHPFPPMVTEMSDISV